MKINLFSQVLKKSMNKRCSKTEGLALTDSFAYLTSPLSQVDQSKNRYHQLKH